MNNGTRRRSNFRRRNRTITISNIGNTLSNIISRFTNQFTRRNRDHLVVPVNESPRKYSSKSISPHISSPVDLEDITTAFGLNKRKSTFRKRGAKKRPSLAQ